ncbi:hypothetical protein AVEN_235680-1 [Araneus ventricosus]|uniref:Uncharacterized protein n=1 Tax=Araneus ventricosus TaxID=182803 RepID=A0A4Y2BTG2_ARAVE|nr:hypothetical protein AVEN_235680-1 [Araneus ventricosus]
MVGSAVGPEFIQMSYGQKKSGLFSGQRIDTSSSKRNNFPTFFVITRISKENETFHGVSPFLVEKAITVKPHATLNSSKGVISCGELLNESEEKITEELKSQGVIHVRRITIRKDGQLLNTKHLILTFDSNKLPTLRGTSSLGVTGITTPRYPSVYFSFRFFVSP